MAVSTTTIKQQVEKQIRSLEVRIKNLRARKLVTHNWREDNLIRFDLIDARRARDTLIEVHKKIES